MQDPADVTRVPIHTVLTSFELMLLLDKFNRLPKKEKEEKNLKTLPILVLDIPLKVIKNIVELFSANPTKDCYHTNGGLNDEGELKDASINWYIKPTYKKTLQERAKAAKLPYEKILLLDQSIRMKHARNHRWCLIWSHPDEAGQNFNLQYVDDLGPKTINNSDEFDEYLRNLLSDFGNHKFPKK